MTKRKRTLRSRKRAKAVLMKMMFMNCGPFIDEYLGYRVGRRSRK